MYVWSFNYICLISIVYKLNLNFINFPQLIFDCLLRSSHKWPKSFVVALLNHRTNHTLEWTRNVHNLRYFVSSIHRIRTLKASCIRCCHLSISKKLYSKKSLSWIKKSVSSSISITIWWIPWSNKFENSNYAKTFNSLCSGWGNLQKIKKSTN